MIPFAEPGSLALWGDFPRQLKTAREGQIVVCIHANHSRAHVLMLNDTGSMRVYECSRDMVHSAERERLWSPE